MRIRSKINGEYVYGWYYPAVGRHFIIHEHSRVYPSGNDWRLDEALVKIDPICSAVATGKKDRNGVELFGSKGVLTDGDCIGIMGNMVVFANGCWTVSGDTLLFKVIEEELEIIPKEQTLQEQE